MTYSQRGVTLVIIGKSGSNHGAIDNKWYGLRLFRGDFVSMLLVCMKNECPLSGLL